MSTMDSDRFIDRKEMPEVGVFVGHPDYPADGYWLQLPLSDKELEEVLARHPEGYTLSDMDTDLRMLYNSSSGRDRLPEINRLVRTIADFHERGWKDMLLFLMAWDKMGGVDDALAILRQGNYEFYRNVTDTESLGHAVAKKGLVVVPESIEVYVDFELIGRDWRANGCAIDEELECAFMQTAT